MCSGICFAGRTTATTTAGGASSMQTRMWTSSTTGMPTSTRKSTVLLGSTPRRPRRIWRGAQHFQIIDPTLASPLPYLGAQRQAHQAAAAATQIILIAAAVLNAPTGFRSVCSCGCTGCHSFQYVACEMQSPVAES